MIQLDNLSLDTLTELAKESFADCHDALQVYLDNEKKLKRFGEILKACREKVPHGQWQQWVLETFAGHLSIRAVQLWIAEAQEPEKRQKRLEHDREQKQKAKVAKAQDLALLPEQPAPAPATPSPPAKPAWLADPDELDRPEEDDLPPLPRTNTHHTSANRRTPDARETDRAGIVPPDDPKTYHDGHWYEWNEDLGRMVVVTDDQILWRGKAIGEARGLVLTVSDTVTESWAAAPVAESANTTSPVVEQKTESVSSKRFTPPTADEVSAYSDEISAGVDGQQFVDFYESKGWMIGKNKMKDWRAAVRTWKRSESQRGSKITTAVRSNRNWDEEIPEWKPTE